MMYRKKKSASDKLYKDSSEMTFTDRMKLLFANKVLFSHSPEDLLDSQISAFYDGSLKPSKAEQVFNDKLAKNHRTQIDVEKKFKNYASISKLVREDSHKRNEEYGEWDATVVDNVMQIIRAEAVETTDSVPTNRSTSGLIYNKTRETVDLVFSFGIGLPAGAALALMLALWVLPVQEHSQSDSLTFSQAVADNIESQFDFSFFDRGEVPSTSTLNEAPTTAVAPPTEGEVNQFFEDAKTQDSTLDDADGVQVKRVATEVD